jgi:hypothetical protein
MRLVWPFYVDVSWMIYIHPEVTGCVSSRHLQPLLPLSCHCCTSRIAAFEIWLPGTSGLGLVPQSRRMVTGERVIASGELLCGQLFEG